MAETKVKQNQLDMTQIADADLSNLSGSAPVGLTNTLAPLPKTVGYTVVGSPTIVNGVVSGFGVANYLALPKLDLANATNMEISMRAKTPAAFASNYWNVILRTSNESTEAWVIGVANDVQTGDKYFDVLGVGLTQYTNVSTDTWYRIKAVKSGTSVTAYLYDDSGTLLTSKQTTVTMTINNDVYLGGRYVNDAHSFGSIDLNNTFIKVNGEYWFVGRWTEFAGYFAPEMSEQYEQLTIGENYASYTAPADGEFYAFGQGSSGSYMNLYKNSDTSADVNQTKTTKGMEMINGNGAYSVRLPVKKGEVIHFSYGSMSFSVTGFTNMGLWFRYAKHDAPQS